jgi:hypothetical protein
MGILCQQEFLNVTLGKDNLHWDRQLRWRKMNDEFHNDGNVANTYIM